MNRMRHECARECNGSGHDRSKIMARRAALPASEGGESSDDRLEDMPRNAGVHRSCGNRDAARTERRAPPDHATPTTQGSRWRCCGSSQWAGCSSSPRLASEPLLRAEIWTLFTGRYLERGVVVLRDRSCSMSLSPRASASSSGYFEVTADRGLILPRSPVLRATHRGILRAFRHVRAAC